MTYLSDNKSYAKKNYSGLAWVRFWIRIYRGYFMASRKMRKTLSAKECYYGPFKGEFGHVLAHTVPFLSYLHSKGVRIHYCGMEIHRPLLVDEAGNSIIHRFYPLRDFFSEVSPRSNSTVPPVDVQAEISKFVKTAESSELPFWNIGNDFYYWFIHRNWQLRKPYMKTYDLEKAYKTNEESAVTVFPRSKGAGYSVNNGGPWDYKALTAAIRPYFDKVYVTGHPALSTDIQPEGNMEVTLTNDNAVVLEKCANSSLIITQHSGAVYLGEYTNCPVLIIYNGEPPIGSISNTLRFKPFIGNKYPFAYAFTMDEVIKFVQQHSQKSRL